MAPAVELRCPGCAEVLARFRRARWSVGRPFEECAKCRAFVSRPSTNEWDLLGPGGRVSWVVDRIAPFLVLGLVPALGHWALVSREGEHDLAIRLGLLCVGPLLVALFPLSAVLRAIRRSRTRMADPMYRARLIEFGRRSPSIGRP